MYTIVDGGQETPLNTFLLNVMPPGGGKSNVMRNIIQPVAQAFLQKTGSNLVFESYTTAGIALYITFYKDPQNISECFSESKSGILILISHISNINLHYLVIIIIIIHDVFIMLKRNMNPRILIKPDLL